MPAPPPHIPRANERTVLQKLSLTSGLPPEKLAGKKLISNMLAKGWIRKQPDGRTYCKTSKGVEAMKALLPAKREAATDQAMRITKR